MGQTGFHQMSMQDLATEANVSVGLIYKYFGGKEDLLLATILRIQDAFRDQLAPGIELELADEELELRHFLCGRQRWSRRGGTSVLCRGDGRQRE